MKVFKVLHMRELKEDNGKLKRNDEQYVVREGSPVGIQWGWAVRWVNQRFVSNPGDRSEAYSRPAIEIPVDETS